jgi:hypothetical protein
MVGETGIDKQPSYDGLIDDCPVVPDRFWNREATGVQDSIEYVTLPECITPGAPWSVQVSAVLHLIWCMQASVCDWCMHAQGHTYNSARTECISAPLQVLLQHSKRSLTVCSLSSVSSDNGVGSLKH